MTKRNFRLELADNDYFLAPVFNEDQLGEFIDLLEALSVTSKPIHEETFAIEYPEGDFWVTVSRNSEEAKEYGITFLDGPAKVKLPLTNEDLGNVVVFLNSLMDGSHDRNMELISTTTDWTNEYNKYRIAFGGCRCKVDGSDLKSYKDHDEREDEED